MPGVHLIEIVSWGVRGRAGNEVIVDDVVPVRTAGIPGTIGVLVVVGHVVDVLGVGLGQGQATMGIGPKVGVPGEEAASLSVRPELLVGWVRVDGILHRDIGRPHRVDIVVLSELDRDVIEDHVAAIEQVDPALPPIGIDEALAEAHVAHDYVRRSVKRNLEPLETNAVARRRLTCDGQVALD